MSKVKVRQKEMLGKRVGDETWKVGGKAKEYSPIFGGRGWKGDLFRYATLSFGKRKGVQG